ncbi:porin [Engelhardtia mirabilis]|uniref:Phosphate-selective porin O and P n=1 Tax=Engelhardtia mirabilis TaxID=2528011 RepID=A0A518BRL7_9BACT|nr:hypothetical protein Pla133_47450 [Planctomycetes bacterium Pla133]QDV03950.1 hypothetical protein Pla86_47430 [Planctomycetes bacterium Pla86]
MRSLFLGATLAVAWVPTAMAGNEADNDWLELDSQLGGLGGPAAYQGSGVDVGVLIRPAYVDSSDFPNVDGEKFGGFVLDDARLFASGNYGQFDWRLSMDFAEGAGGLPVEAGPPPDGQTFQAELLDAYARWQFSDAFGVQIGQFNSRDAFSGDVYQGRLLFADRSIVGRQFNEFDLGLQIDGSYGNQEYPELEWALSVLNGNDGPEDDLDLRARIDINALGNGGSVTEGAYGVENEANGTFGLFWGSDGDVDGAGSSGTIWGADYRGNYGPFGLGVEYFDFDDDAALAADFGMDSAQVLGAYASYLFGAEQNWEAGVRWEDVDSAMGPTRWTVGLNYYVSGHDIKWQLNWVDTDSDVAAAKGSYLKLGLTIGMSAEAN